MDTGPDRNLTCLTLKLSVYIVYCHWCTQQQHFKIIGWDKVQLYQFRRRWTAYNQSCVSNLFITQILLLMNLINKYCFVSSFQTVKAVGFETRFIPQIQMIFFFKQFVMDGDIVNTNTVNDASTILLLLNRKYAFSLTKCCQTFLVISDLTAWSDKYSEFNSRDIIFGNLLHGITFWYSIK